MIFVLLFILIILLIINLLVSKFDFIAPNVVFSASFTFSTFMCALFYNKWDVSLSLPTFFIILIGNILFSAICIFLSKKTKLKKSNLKISKISVSKKYEIIFIIFGIITLVCSAIYVTNAVGYKLINLRPALYAFRDKIVYRNENIGYPLVLNLMTGIMHAGGFWFIFAFLNNWISNKKVDVLMLINIVLCFLSTFLEGSRSMAINYILFGIGSYIYIINVSNEFKKSISIKELIKFIIVGIVILSTFKFSALLVGRDNAKSFSTIEYVAIYTGAEIKNLDLFMEESNDIEYQFGKYTFSSIYSSIAPYLNLDKNFSFPFKKVNGYELGNVYTVFYHFFMDGGYIGVVIFSIFMGAIAQLLYNNSKVILNKKGLPINGMTYCYCFCGILYSFFSNHFFGLIVSFSFIKYLIVWMAMNYIFINREENINENICCNA